MDENLASSLFVSLVGKNLFESTRGILSEKRARFSRSTFAPVRSNTRFRWFEDDAKTSLGFYELGKTIKALIFKRSSITHQKCSGIIMSVVNPFPWILLRTSSSIISLPRPFSSPKNVHELCTLAKSFAETLFKIKDTQSLVNCEAKRGQLQSISCWRSKWHARWRVVIVWVVVWIVFKAEDDVDVSNKRFAPSLLFSSLPPPYPLLCFVLFDLRRRLVGRGGESESIFSLRIKKSQVSLERFFLKKTRLFRE